MCFDIRCDEDDESSQQYWIGYSQDDDEDPIEMEEPCQEHGQVIHYPLGVVVCADPALICTKRVSPHIGSDENPFGNPEGAYSLVNTPEIEEDEQDNSSSIHYPYLSIFIIIVLLAL